MQLDRYRDRALVTLNPETTDRAQNACLGLIGELGEVADLLKKHRFQGHPLDRPALLAELGDLCWYVALASSVHGTSLQEPPDLSELGPPSDPLERLTGEVLWVTHAVARVCQLLAPGVRCPAHWLEAPLGNVLRFVSLAAYLMESDLDQVLEGNLAKLRARYPEGFQPGRSLDR